VDCEGRRTLQTSVGLGWRKYAWEAQTRAQGCAEIIAEFEIEGFVDGQRYYSLNKTQARIYLWMPGEAGSGVVQ